MRRASTRKDSCPMNTAKTRSLRTVLIGLSLLFCPAAANAGISVGTDALLDPGFSPSSAAGPGWRRTWFPTTSTLAEKAVAIARTADGGYVVAGRLPGGSLGAAGAQIGLVKLLGDGSYDTAFGTLSGASLRTGLRVKDAAFSDVRDMTIDSLGRIVVVGTTTGALGQLDISISRFLANGDDDASFGVAGTKVIALDRDAANNRVNDEAMTVTAGANGSVYVAGAFDDVTRRRLVVLWLDSSGTQTALPGQFNPVNDFCVNGCSPTSQPTVARVIYRPQSNQLLLVGSYRDDTLRYKGYLLMRSLVTASYSEGGLRFDDIFTPYDYFITGASLDGNSLLISGRYNTSVSYGFVRRQLLQETLNSTADPAFGNRTGGVHFLTGVANTAYNDVRRRSDGSIVVAGKGAGSGLVVRLTSNGQQDAGFVNGAEYVSYAAPTTGAGYPASSDTEFVRLVLDGGKPVIAGSSLDSTGTSSDFDFVTMRLRSDLIFRDGF